MGFNGRRPPGGCRGGRLPSFKTLVVPTRYGAETALASTVALPQHPDQHRPERSILLAVDQEFGEGAALWVAPELADPLGSVGVWEARAGYRSLGKIILSTARAPILTTTYTPSQPKRTVTSVAQLMGSVNHGKTSAVPRSAPRERNRPCPPPDELGVLTHSLPARGHRLSLDQMARVPRLAPGLVASPSLRPHLHLVPAPHSAAGVLGKGSGEPLLVGQLVGARCLLTPRSSAISTRLIPRDVRLVLPPDIRAHYGPR